MMIFKIKNNKGKHNIGAASFLIFFLILVVVFGILLGFNAANVWSYAFGLIEATLLLSIVRALFWIKGREIRPKQHNLENTSDIEMCLDQ